VQRTLVARGDLAQLPGFEARLYLVEYPPGIEAGVHTHTEQCVGYVIEGRFASAYGDGPVTVKQAGDGFVDLPSKAHHFKNLDPVRPLRFLVTGTFRKEEPLLRAVSGATGVASGTEPLAAEAVALPPFGPVTEVKRSLLVQREIDDLPGMESRIYLVEFPPGGSQQTAPPYYTGHRVRTGGQLRIGLRRRQSDDQARGRGLRRRAKQAASFQKPGSGSPVALRGRRHVSQRRTPVPSLIAIGSQCSPGWAAPDRQA
jgi:quercetin dioxygenase-like cupin family protein